MRERNLTVSHLPQCGLAEITPKVAEQDRAEQSRDGVSAVLRPWRCTHPLLRHPR